MIRIHHITDSHFSRADCRIGEYVDALMRGDLGPRPNLILHTGDLVDGAPDLAAADAHAILQAQHTGLHALLTRTGVDVHALCHTHDRRGDPSGAWGRTFTETWNQPLAQVVQLPDGLDLVLLSGSVTLPPLAVQCDAPTWGFDVFDPHVLDALEDLVSSHCRRKSTRVLCTHLPILLTPDYPRPNERYRHVPIGEEGRARILPVLQRLQFRLVLGGHLHLPSRVQADNIEFIVGNPLLSPNPGYGELTFADGHLHYMPRMLHLPA